MLDPEYLWFISMSAFVFGAIFALVLRHQAQWANVVGHVALVVGALCNFGIGCISLYHGETVYVTQLQWLPYSAFEISIDAIGAFFICLISLSAIVVGIYAIGYTKEYYGRNHIGWLVALLNFFVAAMLLVVSVNNAVAFLVAWEMMSLVSYFLVVYEQKGAATTRAGFTYIVMTHAGTAAIMALFFVLYSLSGSFDFGRMFTVPLTVMQQNLIFLLALVGFGTKAGLVPLHIWLPVAHPAAPSHVSALMSGVMVKTALYAFLRVVLPMSAEAPLWWGFLLLLLGLISALLGVMYALVERDIKRLLAYSTVENIGILFMTIGVMLCFLSVRFQLGAALAAAAFLLHAFNHSIFKGLLFMAAGAVAQATHTKDMDKLGGLIRKMPATAAVFFIGAAAIAALPPLNGFFGEWLLYQSLFHLGVTIKVGITGIVGPVAIALLGLVGALVIATFVKLFGAIFLAQSRVVDLAHIEETSFVMRQAMWFMAVLCIAGGVGSPYLLRTMDHTVIQMVGISSHNITAGGLFLANIGESSSGLAPIGIIIALVLVGAIMLAFDRIWGRHNQIRIDETWGCGINLTPRMEYTGTSFSQPFKVIFHNIFLPERSLQRDYAGHPYFTRVLRYQSTVTPVFERYLYAPGQKLLLKLAERLRGIQTGRLQMYLGYIFATLIIVLMFAK